MTLENIKLDIDYVRSQFPAFSDSLSKDWSFFENAGGSYVPQQVVDQLNKFMISTKVQPYAEYTMSKLAGQNMDKATKLFAKMINAKKNEIIIGIMGYTQGMTQLKIAPPIARSMMLNKLELLPFFESSFVSKLADILNLVLSRRG